MIFFNRKSDKRLPPFIRYPKVKKAKHLTFQNKRKTFI